MESPAHKVLILEDSPERIKVFSRKLIGHQVFITDQAKEAISLIKDHAFDIIYLDHDLDGMTFVDWNTYDNTGMKFVKYLEDIQSLEYYSYLKKIPIIIHSHNFEAANAMRMRLLGAGYYAFCTPFWQIAGHEYRREFAASPVDTINFNNKTHDEMLKILKESSINQVDRGNLVNRLSVLVENYNSHLEKIHKQAEQDVKGSSS